mmetsp:Transcript_42033/g.112883  ORF Transcript_42033/g.112883 Transcript_42033/m.112883 type:complete len:482 (-) Transcript_42033:205-1650(-)
MRSRALAEPLASPGLGITQGLVCCRVRLPAVALSNETSDAVLHIPLLRGGPGHYPQSLPRLETAAGGGDVRFAAAALLGSDLDPVHLHHYAPGRRHLRLHGAPTINAPQLGPDLRPPPLDALHGQRLDRVPGRVRVVGRVGDAQLREQPLPLCGAVRELAVQGAARERRGRHARRHHVSKDGLGRLLRRRAAQVHARGDDQPRPGRGGGLQSLRPHGLHDHLHIVGPALLGQRAGQQSVDEGIGGDAALRHQLDPALGFLDVASLCYGLDDRRVRAPVVVAPLLGHELEEVHRALEVAPPAEGTDDGVVAAGAELDALVGHGGQGPADALVVAHVRPGAQHLGVRGLPWPRAAPPHLGQPALGAHRVACLGAGADHRGVRGVVGDHVIGLHPVEQGLQGARLGRLGLGPQRHIVGLRVQRQPGVQHLVHELGGPLVVAVRGARASVITGVDDGGVAPHAGRHLRLLHHLQPLHPALHAALR